MNKNFIRTKLLSAILASVIAASALTGCSAADAAKDLQNALSVYSSAAKDIKADSIDLDDIEQVASLRDIPAIGETVNGFEVTGLYDYPEKEGILVSMEHVQSGANLIWLANNDQDMGFNVYYRTKPSNNKGIPHVFEHITLSGSGEYPSASLWDQVAISTYNTFMNASTYPQMTGYYIASLSEDQLLSIADFYMSGLTDPIALRDSNPLKRESSRYQLYDMDGDITVTGAVFNEMESSNSNIFRTNSYELAAELFPGSSASYSAYGLRNDIIEITLDELNEYYDKYYHPSNMLIAIYGDMNYERFLSMLDEKYLSNYEKQEIDLTEENYSPWSGYKSTINYHPAEEGTSIDNAGFCSYEFVLNDTSISDLGYISIICRALSSPSSPLVQRLEKDFPNIYFECNLDLTSLYPAVKFYFDGSNQGDEEAIKTVIDEEFAKIAKDGLDKDILNSIINSVEAETLIESDSHGGTDLMTSFALAWASSADGNVAAFIDYISSYRNLRSAADEGYIDELFNDYFVNPRCSVMVNTIPKPGLYEQELAKFEQRLADMKDSMTYWEKKQLIQDTEQFDSWSKKDANTSILDKVSCLNVADIPETLTEVSVRNEEIDGIRMLSYTNENCGYLEAHSYYNASAVPTDKLLDYNLMCALLGNMPTANHSAGEVFNLIKASTYEYNIDSSIFYDHQTGVVMPYLEVGYTTLDSNIESADEIFDDILTSTDFTDLEKARAVINNAYNTLKNSSSDAQKILDFQINYALAQQDDNKKYAYYLLGTEYLDYLRDLVNADDETLAAKLNELNDILNLVLNKNGIIYTASGDAAAIEYGQKHITSFADSLNTYELATVDYASELAEILDMKSNFSYILSDSNNYNACIASSSLLSEYGLPYNGMNSAIARAIDSYVVYPAFRYDIGAYGGHSSFNKNGLYLYSYEDPCITESLEALNQIPEMMLESGVTQDEIDTSILSCLSSLAYPKTRKEQAQKEFSFIIENWGITNSAYTHKLIREAKSTTEDDFYATAPLLLNVIENASFSSCGSNTNITPVADKFDVIIDSFIK